jgi:hypothetical protein
MTALRTLAAALLITAAAPSLAGADEWVNRPVRITFGANPAPIGGKFMRMDRCLYVRLDTARDGLTLIRLDQVSRLQVNGGGRWIPQDVKPMLAREPAHCLEEANG